MSRKKSPKIARAPLLTRLRLAYRVKFPPIPPGFKPVSVWAREWGVSIATATRLLKSGVATKAIIARQYKMRASNGTGILTTCYRER